MTESEWLESADPMPMLEFLQGKASDRKLRLCCSACCYRYSMKFKDTSTNKAAALLMRYADGQIGESERLYPNTFSHHDLVNEMWGGDAYRSALGAAGLIAGDVGRQFNYGAKQERAMRMELQAQSLILRDIFGNPFHAVPINPIWLTPTVLSLAQTAYDERIMPSGELAPDRLAVLSDAAEEAGSDQKDILEHLRSPGPHVRGCWALDLLLGKE